MAVSTHVLDASAGRPAAGVDVRLERLEKQVNGGYEVAGRGRTDADGRIRTWTDGPPDGASRAGTYRLVFDTGGYFAAHGTPTFYPEVTITFTVTEPEENHHVPLLLSPFAYSTYRGS